ncbi:Glycosyltransferase BC10 [Trichinella spiralis]|uniref:Glycosyltransferase BC10 n=1 Tax=Trichinella spiralis TaxID=6334 RepID=A0ABR3K7H3_TRISP
MKSRVDQLTLGCSVGCGVLAFSCCIEFGRFQHFYGDDSETTALHCLLWSFHPVTYSLADITISLMNLFMAIDFTFAITNFARHWCLLYYARSFSRQISANILHIFRNIAIVISAVPFHLLFTFGYYYHYNFYSIDVDYKEEKISLYSNSINSNQTTTANIEKNFDKHSLYITY